MIRSATADDSAALAQLAAVTFPLACPPHTSPDAIANFISTNLSLAAFEGYLADPDRDLFISETDSVPNGYAMVVYAEPNDAAVAAAVRSRPTAELSKLYVHADHHGGGIALSLVECTVEAARSRGAASLWLGTNQENGRANRFYEKSGFTLAGKKTFLVGDRYEDDNVWALQL